jgi:hypothetical protein
MNKTNYPKHTCSFSIKSMIKNTLRKESSNHLAKRLDNKKKSILQFFTKKCLYDISTIKTLQFNNTKLKLII